MVRIRNSAVSVRLIVCLLGLLGGSVALASAKTAVPQDPRQVWQLLDYIAVDYPGAVADGRVLNPSEFNEMQEFAARARTQLADLPDRSGRAALLSAASALEHAIAKRDAPEAVSKAARRLANELLATYSIPLAPASVPDLARGRRLYLSDCSRCHGQTGAADGALGKTLIPRPVAFTDAKRARQRSPFSYYQVISQGIDGTTMVSFAGLPESDRWALAFYISTLAYSDSERRAGEKLWRTRPDVRARVPNLAVIARSSEDEINSQFGSASSEALAYLRSHPEAVSSLAQQGVGAVRERLAQSLNAYSAGESTRAQQLALSAYLDDFEPLEPLLAATDAPLLSRVESAMSRFRDALDHGAPAADIKTQASHLESLLEDVDRSLIGTQGDATPVFLGALTILLREGLEALLIVVAIIAFLRKAQRTDLLPYVHGGWTGALIAGLTTWAIASYFINVTGANREVTEGVSSLLAAAVLLSVGLWMHSKSVAGRWQEYLRERLSRALSRRSAWFLAGLAFLAVYRELLETLLFYVALWSQGEHHALLAGLGVGILVLGLIAYGLLRATRSLPISQFFTVSSLLIALLAVVLVGKGVVALQEAGLVELRTINVPRVAVLGIYPSLQSLLAQLAVVALLLIGFSYNRSGMHRIRGSGNDRSCPG